MPSVATYVADYEDPVHAKAVVDLLDGYARDPYGNSGPLPDEVYASLCPTLAKTPGAFSVVATVDGVAAGLINCFQGFSTFKCKPLINVHDVFVHPEHRRAGLVQAMMAVVEDVAKERGACKLTLEVLSNNAPAKGSYAKFGFKYYELDPAQGHAEFWEKTFR